MAETSLTWNAMAAEAERLVRRWPSDEPGGAILGFDMDGVKFSASHGVESLSTFSPFRPDTVVRFASVTKHAFCAMCCRIPTASRWTIPWESTCRSCSRRSRA